MHRHAVEVDDSGKTVHTYPPATMAGGTFAYTLSGLLARKYAKSIGKVAERTGTPGDYVVFGNKKTTRQFLVLTCMDECRFVQTSVQTGGKRARSRRTQSRPS